MKKIRDDDALTAAQELIGRLGRAARQDAAERVAELDRLARWPEHAVAVRVLTAVENLLDAKLP